MEERLPIRGTGDELDKLSQTINRFLGPDRRLPGAESRVRGQRRPRAASPLAAIQSSVDVTLNTNRSVEEYEDLLGEIAGECGQLERADQPAAASGRNRHGALRAGEPPVGSGRAWSNDRSICSAARPRSAASN